MSGRSIIFVITATVALGCATPLPLPAGELGEFLSSVSRDAKRRNCWPEPFVYSDRAAIRQTIAIQDSAGWERENLLSEFHFLPGGAALTEAGRLQVQWVMNEVSEPHRQIYVHRAATPQETAMRMQTVQRFVGQFTYGGGPPIPVIESTRSDDGWPADRIDALSKKLMAATMDPKLMGSSTTGAGGASSGH